MKAPLKSVAHIFFKLAIVPVGIPASFAAVDMNFTHGVDIYTYGQPPGPDTIINEDAYLRTHTLQGTQTRRSEWLQMNVTNYYAHREGFGGGAWQWGALPPNTTYFTSGTSARLYKGSLNNPNAPIIGGNPAGGAGIYSGMDRVSFLLWEQTPVADLSTVIFQAYLTTGSEPGFVTNPYQDVNGDFHVAGGGLPALTLFFADGTTRQLTAQDSTAELYQSRATLFDHIPVEEGSEESIEMYIYENYRSYRWDLNNMGLVSSDIVRFGIEFTIEAHVSLRSLSLDQAGGVVPEPTTSALFFGLALTALTLLRRRR